jgi:hypothetical protein
MSARINRERTVLISSVDRAADPTQGGDCLGGRMAVNDWVLRGVEDILKNTAHTMVSENL